VCVLFRTNAQSRALEIAFRRLGVPYDLVGGVSFYERKEVKDVLAYLRAALNPRDSVSFLRILNTPRRGLGDRVRQQLEARVTAGEPPGDALGALAAAGALSSGSTLKARALLDLLDEIRARAGEPADRLLEETLRRTEYLAYLDEAHPQDAAERRENLEELLVAARQFAEQGSEAENGGSLVGFLTEAALVADVDRWAEDDDRVALLTMHNAKGLEFPVVVLAGLEEGLLPQTVPQTLETVRFPTRDWLAALRPLFQDRLSAARFQTNHFGPQRKRYTAARSTPLPKKPFLFALFQND